MTKQDYFAKFGSSDASMIIWNIAAYLQKQDGMTDDGEIHFDVIDDDYTKQARTAYYDHYNAIGGKPAVYVGTYGQYNHRSSFGMWIDMSTFEDTDEFYEFCRAVHSHESDPEFMWQDYESFPSCWYNECPDREDAEAIIKFAKLNNEDREMLEAYMETTEDTATIEQARDCYIGTFGSDEEFAEHIYADLVYDLPSIIKNNINWSHIADQEMEGVCSANGYYFTAS